MADDDELYEEDLDDDAPEERKEPEKDAADAASETLTLTKEQLREMISESNADLIRRLKAEADADAARQAKAAKQPDDEDELDYSPTAIRDSAAQASTATLRMVSSAVKQLKTEFPELDAKDFDDIEEQLFGFAPSALPNVLESGVHRMLANSKVGDKFKSGKLKGVGKPPAMVTPTHSQGSKQALSGTALRLFAKHYGRPSKAAALRLREAGD